MSSAKTVPSPASLEDLPELDNSKVCWHEDHVENILKKQQTFYEEQKFCDIVLTAGIDGIKLPAHRIVLAAASNYFSTMFSGTMKEANSREIKIDKVDGKTLKTLVDFMYSGAIELCHDRVEAIFRSANFFQIDTLVDICCEYIVQRLDPSNCLGTSFFAEQMGSERLYEASFDFACKHFERVCKEDEFLGLNEIQLGKLLSEDHLSVSSEEIVFHGLVAWIEQSKDREKLLLQLLPHIRFPWLESTFIVKHKNSVCKSPACSQLVSDWLEWHQNPVPERITPRAPRSRFAIITDELLTHRLRLQVYDPRSDKWCTNALPGLNWPEGFYSWVYANSKIIVAGRGEGDVSTNRKSIECLDLQTMKWTNMPSMLTARVNFEMAELNGQLYVVGDSFPGRWVPTKSVPCVEKFDFNKQKWKKVTPMPGKLGKLGVHVAAVNGRLYVMSEEKCTLYCFDPLANKWSRKAYKNEVSTLFSMTAVCGYIFTIGGCYRRQASNTVERYDTKTDTWTTVCPLKIPRMNVKSSALGNRLLAFGGSYSGQGPSPHLVEEYDPQTDEWRYLGSLDFYTNCLCTPFEMY